MNPAKAFAATLAIAFAVPVAAEQTFAAYEGPAAIQTGTGGTKITKNGIDYWTSGTPPRRYQVLGILTDARKDRPTDGNVLGSKSVAKRTLEAGGNAVIFGDQSAKVSGASAFATESFAATTIQTRTTTQLLVVKYLDD